MASYPDFDPSVFVDGSPKKIQDVISDPANRLLNRAIGGNYPAGSTFKAISAAAGLQDGFISADEADRVAGSRSSSTRPSSPTSSTARTAT